MRDILDRKHIGRAGLALALTGLLVPKLVGLSTSFAADGTYTLDEFTVVGRDTAQINPRVDGRNVVWQDYRNNDGAPTNTGEANADIFLKKLGDDGSGKRVNEDANKAKVPDISGNVVVWTQASDSHGLDIRGYDIKNDNTFTVEDADGDQDNPAIYADTVVYQDHRGDNWDIRAYNINDDHHFTISSNKADQTLPAVGDHLVAWVDYRDGADNPNIFAYDLNEKREFRVSDTNDAFSRPAVSGDFIVYSAGGNDQGINVYDQADGSTRQISTTTQRKRYSPNIDGNLIVWTDERRGVGKQDIWGYDLSAGQEFEVQSGGNDKFSPDISEQTFVWVDEERNGDIHGADLTISGGATPTPSTSPTTAPTSGPGATPTPITGSPPPPAPPVPHDNQYFSQTGFRIDDPAIWDYFNSRGKVDTFGFPISRTFMFLGFRTQFFQRQLVQIGPDGNARLLNLLDPGLLDVTKINGSTFPGVDAAFKASAPTPADPNYDTKIIEFVQVNAPETFNNQPTRYWTTFNNTVTCQDAFPNGNCIEGLIPGFNLEMWGAPTSHPAADPANGNFIYQRFQRGIMHYDSTCQCTRGILLASYLKDVVTNHNLPADLGQEMQGTKFFNQYNNSAPLGMNRPGELPGSDLSNAFEQG